ncbi:hypothetical protein BP5796_01245 [Coleophoma crateriformis]|uniref:Uncharacterized protein n=1 Tax=Coleophoma crateriformis TaxID=565419 RepID=A0A3D8T099_9HELO|nr:hypothetical protein BP5796_01245 [Coleophoma crateriformis]
MKAVFGDDIFPFDSWKEFKIAIDDIEEDYSFKEYTQHMFGGRGIGCKIPLSIQIFCFDKTGESSMTWSSSLALGWIEEDLEWFYERFVDSDFDGARMWYEFPGYYTLKKRSDELSADKTAMGDRHRRFFGNYSTDSNTARTQATLPSSKKNTSITKSEPQSVEEINDEVKSVLPMVTVKDFCTAFSEFVPGMGEMIEERVYSLMQKSMIMDDQR